MEYNRICIVPMWRDSDETNVWGKDIPTVQKTLFNTAIKKGMEGREPGQYFYHGKMIDIKQGECILVLFQYQGMIIACGTAIDRIKAGDDRFVQPTGDKVRYDGVLVLAQSVCVEPISLDELKSIGYIGGFSNVIRDIPIDKKEKLEILIEQKRMLDNND